MDGDYYEKRYNRFIHHFDHVTWCGISNVRVAIDMWKSETNASNSTWYHRITELVAFHRWCMDNGETPRKQAVLNYYAELRERGCRGSSIRAVHIRLKAFFDYLYKNDLYIDAMHGVAVPTGEYREKTCLNAGEVRTLLQRITRIRDKAIVSLMVYCGLRCVEISEMQWGDMDGDRMMVRGKGRKDKAAIIVLPISVQNLLREWKAATPGGTDDADFVFVSDCRRCCAPLSSVNVSKTVRYILKCHLPEKKGITPHGLRHTAITLAVEAGLDIHRVSRFARHKSISTTSVYLHDNEKFTDPVESHIESMVETQERPQAIDAQIKQALLKLLKS